MTPQEFKLKIDDLPNNASRIRVEDVNILKGDVDRVSSFSSEQKTEIKKQLDVLLGNGNPRAKKNALRKLKNFVNGIVPQNSSSNETPTEETEEESDSTVVLENQEAKARIRELRIKVLKKRLETFKRKSATVQAQSGDTSRGEIAVGPEIGPRVREIRNIETLLNDPNSNLDVAANYLDVVEAENKKKSIVGYNFESNEREEKIYREKMEERLLLLDASSQKLFNSLVERMGFLSPEDFEQKIGEVVKKIPEYQTLVDEATKDMSNEDKEIFIEYLGSMDKATGTIEEFNGAVVKAMENFPKVSKKFKEAVEGLSPEEKTIARRRIISYSPSEISSEVTSLKEREDLGSVERNARDLIYDEEVGLDPKQRTMFRKEANAKIKPLLSGSIGISEFEKLIVKIRSRYTKDIFIPEAGEKFKETVVGGAIYETKREVDRGRYTELEAFVRQQTEELFRGSTLQKTILVLFKGRLGMVLSGAVGVVRKLLGVFGSLAGALGSLVTSIVEFTKKIVSTTMSIGWSLLKWIGILTLLYKTGLLQKIGPFITEFLRTITPFLLDVVKSVFSAMNDFLESAIESLAGGVGGEAWGRKLKDFFFGREGLFSTEVARKTGEELKRFFRNIRNILPILGTVVKDMIDGIVTIMKDFVYPEIIKPLLSSFFEWMETDGLGQKFKEYVYDPVTSLAKAVWWIGKKIAWIIENPMKAFGIYAAVSLITQGIIAGTSTLVGLVAAAMRSATFMQFAAMPGNGLGKAGGLLNMFLPAAIFGGATMAGGGAGAAAATAAPGAAVAAGGVGSQIAAAQALSRGQRLRQGLGWRNTAQYMPAAGQRGAGVANMGRTGMLLAYGETAIETGMDAYGQIQQGDYGDAAVTVGAGVAKGASIWGGAKLGAMIGTAIAPGLGTALGGLVGGAFGYFAGDLMYESMTEALDEDELSEDEEAYLDSIDTSLKDMNKRDRDEALRRIEEAKENAEVANILVDILENNTGGPNYGQIFGPLLGAGGSGQPQMNREAAEFIYDKFDSLLMINDLVKELNKSMLNAARGGSEMTADEALDKLVIDRVIEPLEKQYGRVITAEQFVQIREIFGASLKQLLKDYNLEEILHTGGARGTFSDSYQRNIAVVRDPSNGELKPTQVYEVDDEGNPDFNRPITQKRKRRPFFQKRMFDGGTILPNNSAVVIEDETAVNIRGQPAIVGDRDPKSPGMPNPELMVNSENGTTIVPLNDPLGKKVLEEYGNSRRKRFAAGGTVLKPDIIESERITEDEFVEGNVQKIITLLREYQSTKDEALAEEYDRLIDSMESLGYTVEVLGENIENFTINVKYPSRENTPRYRELNEQEMPLIPDPKGRFLTTTPLQSTKTPPKTPPTTLPITPPTTRGPFPPTPTNWSPSSSQDTTLPAQTVDGEELLESLEDVADVTVDNTEAISGLSDKITRSSPPTPLGSLGTGTTNNTANQTEGRGRGDELVTIPPPEAPEALRSLAGATFLGDSSFLNYQQPQPYQAVPRPKIRQPKAPSSIAEMMSLGERFGGGGASDKPAAKLPDNPEAEELWEAWKNLQVSIYVSTLSGDDIGSPQARKILGSISERKKQIIGTIRGLYGGNADEKAMKNKKDEMADQAKKEARMIVDKAGTAGGAKSFSLKDPIVELEQLQKQRQEQEGKLKTLDEIDAAEGRVETMEKRNIEIAGKIKDGGLESFFKKKEENQEALTELNKVSSKADDEKSQQGIEKLEKTEEYVELLKRKQANKLDPDGEKKLADLAKELNLPKMEDDKAAIEMMTERSESLKKSLGDLAVEGSDARKELDARRGRRSELEGDLDKARQYESMMGEMRSNTGKIAQDRTFLAQNADLASRKDHERNMINMELQRIDGESSFYGGTPGTPGTKRGVDMTAVARMAQEQEKSEERAKEIKSLSGTKREIEAGIASIDREDEEFIRLSDTQEKDAEKLTKLKEDSAGKMKEYDEYKSLKKQEKDDEQLASEIARYITNNPEALSDPKVKKYVDESKKKLDTNNKRRKELYEKFEGEGSKERIAEIESIANEILGLEAKGERLEYLRSTRTQARTEKSRLSQELGNVQGNLDSLIEEDAAYGASLASGSQYFDPNADNSARFDKIAVKQEQAGTFEKMNMVTTNANLLEQNANSLQGMVAAGTVMDKEEVDYSAKGYADSEDRISAALQYMTPEDRERFETLMASIKGGGKERRNFAEKLSKFDRLDKTKEQRKKELEFLDTKMKSGADLTESERERYEQLQSSEKEYSNLSAWRESEQYAKSEIDYNLESKRRSEIQSISGKYGIDSSSLMRDLGEESVDPSEKTGEWKPSDLVPVDTMKDAPVGGTQAQGAVVINNIIGGSTNNQTMTAAPSAPPIVIAPARTSSSQAVLGRDSYA